MFSENKIYWLKVILVGECGVGKTSIVRQYIDDIFDKNLQSTFGGTFCTKKIFFGKKRVILEIWDTAGQERYGSLYRMCYTNSNIVLFVFDLKDKRSFEEIKNYWFGKVKEATNDDVIFAVVGNKVDLYDELGNNDDFIKNEEGRNFAKSINALYFETSSKRHENIEDLFKTVAKKYLDTHSSPIGNSSSTSKQKKLSEKKIRQKKNSC